MLIQLTAKWTNRFGVLATNTSLSSLDWLLNLLRMFYQSVVASNIFFAVVCWGDRVRAVNANRINKLIRKAGCHIPQNVLVTHRSTFSSRLLPPCCITEHHRKFFLPMQSNLITHLSQAEKWTAASSTDCLSVHYDSLTYMTPKDCLLKNNCWQIYSLIVVS